MLILSSGENFMNVFCNSIGWCKFPIFCRMLELKTNAKIVFLYGSESWVIKDPGFDVIFNV